MQKEFAAAEAKLKISYKHDTGSNLLRGTRGTARIFAKRFCCSDRWFDPQPDLDNANVGMSEINFKNKRRQRPIRILPAVLFHVELYLKKSQRYIHCTEIMSDVQSIKLFHFEKCNLRISNKQIYNHHGRKI